LRDKLYIGIIGIGLSVVGWVALNAQHFPFVYRIVAPRYYDALKAVEGLTRKDASLDRGDSGFPELAGILKSLMGKDRTVEIVGIKSLGAVQGPMNRAEGAKWVGYLGLEIHYRSLSPEVWQIGALESAIKQKYLPLNLFLWGSLILGIGLLLNLMALLMKD
jgi:hypothetical protein